MKKMATPRRKMKKPAIMAKRRGNLLSSKREPKMESMKREKNSMS